MAGSAASAIQVAAASLLSTLKNKFRTSEKALKFVVQEFNKLTGDLFVNFIKEELSAKCAFQDGYLTLENIFSKLEAALRGQSLFEGVNSQPYLDSYIAHLSADNPFGLTQVIFETKVVFRNGIPHEVPKDFAYFPSFLPQLEQLLNCKDVLHCVDNPRESVDGVFKSVTDGYFYRFHYIVRQHGNKTLCIMIYVDDVEFADPCKTKTKKHKLRMFYWTLGNIYPELRSTLKAINLLAIVRYEVAKKWGNEEILKHFVKDLCDLSNGVKLCINGVDRIFYGILQFVAADIPAAANLGGLKETHCALRPCRMCMVTRYELCDHFREDDSLLRRIEDHNKYLQEIEGLNFPTPAVRFVSVNINEEQDDIGNVDSEDESGDVLQEERPAGRFTDDHPNPSIRYGVNARSVLGGAPGFDVTKCLPYDVMHVLFEGIAELVCRLILKDMCTVPKKPTENRGAAQQPKRRKKNEQPREKPKISLQKVNQIIQECSDFGHLNVSKPSPIDKSHLTKSKLKQSASQMIVLLHVLPIIAHGNVSVEKMELLGQLIKIIALAMKFEQSEEDIQNLESTIEIFGQNFVKLYPGYKTLKLHALKHLKMQIYLHGPLRQQACFRYEGMHRLFTRLVDVINNMLNIEFSLACRHLAERNCDIANGRHDGTFLYEGDKVQKSQSNKLNNMPEKDIILQSFPEHDEETDVATVKIFERHGRSWRKDVVFSLQGTHVGSATTKFGIIVKIYCINDEMLFLYNNLKVTYLDNFYAFEVQARDNNLLRCLKFSDIRLQFPVPRFTVQLARNRTKSYLVPGSSGDILS